MKLLVTGGSGFIGSHVVDQLLAAGHDVRGFDVIPSPYPLPDECSTIVGDLLDPASLTAAAEGCDAIVHLAAAADVGLVAKDPAGSESLNARGTLNVLEAARQTGAFVVYASTIWVYSDVHEPEVDEDTRLAHPSHLYTATKLAGEMYCRSYGELYDVPSTILRFGIPYGPRARPAAVLPIFVNKALAGEPLTIAGDGSQTRRFVYVEDLADGVVRALAPEARGRIYNLVGEQDTSVRDIADAVRASVGDVAIVHTEGRTGDFAGARVCGERAARELGWRAQTPFAEGVRRYVAWHRDDAERAALAAATPALIATTAAPAAAAGLAAARLDAPPVAAGFAAARVDPPPVAAPRQRGARSLGGLAALPSHVRHAVAGVGGIAAVILYVLVLTKAGLSSDRQHTVLVVAALGLAATMSTVTTRARVAVWLTALIGAVILIPSPTSGALDFAHLTLPLLALGLAGSGFGLLGVIGSRRGMLEPALAERGDR